MIDLIDRQAVIDLLKQMRKDGDMVPWEGKDVFARIRKLPTIQPEKAQLSNESTTSDLISRQAAIDELPYLLDYDGLKGENGFVSKRLVRKMLKELPPAQPEPKEGHWIWVAGELMCSECRTIYSDLYPDYDNAVACPHCGAKMKGAQNG